MLKQNEKTMIYGMTLEEFTKTPIVFVNINMSKKERKQITEQGYMEFYKGTRYFSIGKLKLEDYEFLHQQLNKGK